jgi:hypothetical protein
VWIWQKTFINYTVLIVTARRSGSDACGALNGFCPDFVTGCTQMQEVGHNLARQDSIVVKKVSIDV